jgi:hypothetical protein
VPSHAAADQLRWTLKQRTLDAGTAQVLPLLLTRDELYAELHRRADAPPPLLGPIERLVCGRAAADEALASGMDPPFRLRPGLVSEFLGLYDELQRRHRSVDTFERLLVDEQDPNAEFDRGARRMLRQTRFLAAMYRAYERRVGESGRLDRTWAASFGAGRRVAAPPAPPGGHGRRPRCRRRWVVVRRL